MLSSCMKGTHLPYFISMILFDLRLVLMGGGQHWQLAAWWEEVMKEETAGLRDGVLWLQ